MFFGDFGRLICFAVLDFVDEMLQVGVQKTKVMRAAESSNPDVGSASFFHNHCRGEGFVQTSAHGQRALALYEASAFARKRLHKVFRRR